MNRRIIPAIEYIPTPGEPFAFVVSEPELNRPIRNSREVFPKEIYYGDTIYFASYIENLSDEAIIPIFLPAQTRISGVRRSISSHFISETYSWLPEYSTTMHDVDALSELQALLEFQILPGEKRLSSKRLSSRHYFEFPPLEDWNAPFWKELREKMPPEGVICQFQMSHWRDSEQKSVVLDILIKPRPENEMALLEKWYKNTPEELFPEVRGHRKVPRHRDLTVPQRSRDLKPSGRSNIRIGLFRYDPWMFIRLGNRKPSDPNNPTTLSGWRELEASLVPSTMRDEVRLVRLQLEYYAASAGEDAETAKNELLTWLQSLPAPQRIVMAASLVYNSSRFTGTTLQSRNQELVRAIQSRRIARHDM